ncbi:MAG: thermonuclease family protein [Deltaproteobacteria bacterium]|nr:thermonuclease family protein [Deltaproteobacteria bacterium]
MIKRVFLFGIFFVLPLFSYSKYSSHIFVNGEPAVVYFNDGDTFRIIEGPLVGSRVRVRGFNSLESYGAVHQWGNWRADELFDNAKAATKNARRNGWHCEVGEERDFYKRSLGDCHDLAVDMVKKGLAHVMFMSPEEVQEDLVELQQEAIKNRMGMWSKGHIDYVITSVHSISERKPKRNTTDELTTSDSESARRKVTVYDRLVSTKNGLSVIKRHNRLYATCQKVNYIPEEDTSSMFYIPFKYRYGKTRMSCLYNETNHGK